MTAIRRLIALSAAATTAFLAASLTAAPARAAYGPPQPVDVQLRGGSTPVGRLVGTVRFDDGNSLYRLDLVLCRQSSYVGTTLTVNVNGAYHQWFSREDGYRPEVCGGHGLSGAVNADIPYDGVVRDVGLVYQGLYFDGATSSARTVVRSATYDSPFN